MNPRKPLAKVGDVVLAAIYYNVKAGQCMMALPSWVRSVIPPGKYELTLSRVGGFEARALSPEEQAEMARKRALSKLTDADKAALDLTNGEHRDGEELPEVQTEGGTAIGRTPAEEGVR